MSNPIGNPIDKTKLAAERLASVMQYCERNLLDLDECMRLARNIREEWRGIEEWNEGNRDIPRP